MYVYMYMYRGYWERKKEALERKIKRERETGEGLHRRGVKEEEEAEESRRREERVDIKYAWTDASSHSSLPFLLPSVSLFFFLLHLVSIISPSFILGAGFPSVFNLSPSLRRYSIRTCWLSLLFFPPCN